MTDSSPSAPLPSPHKLSADQRLAGLLVPVFALRREGDLGIGDTTAIRELADFCRDAGFRMIQVLPINETGGDNSPYNAISSVALEPALLDVSPRAIPDLRENDYHQAIGSVASYGLTEGPVNYDEVKPLKLGILGRAYASFCENAPLERQRAFARFREENRAWLRSYTFFRTLMEWNETEVYDHWPEPQRKWAVAQRWLGSLHPADRKAFEQRQQFFAYVQWIAYDQWCATRMHCLARGVHLMGDIPLGIGYYSADVYGHPEIFRLRWACGAPPEKVFEADEFTRQWGQNWGVPLFHWEQMEAYGFPWWKQRVAKACEVFAAIRIDHILGFFRVFAFPWRPELNQKVLEMSQEEILAMTGGLLPQFIPRADDTEEMRQLNAKEGTEKLRAVLEAAGDSLLIGEDLGVVPPYVRPALHDLGILGFRIPHWEVDYSNGLLFPPESFDRLSLATWATHDHPPIKCLWRDLRGLAMGDPATMERLNKKPGDRDVIDGAKWEYHRVCQQIGLEKTEPPQEFNETVHLKLLEGLFRTNSALAIVMITDLLGTEQRFNVPGSVSTSNWSNRLTRKISRLKSDPDLQSLLHKISTLIQETGRME